MPLRVLLSLLLAWIIAFPALGRENPTFAGFEGFFSKYATGKVSGGYDVEVINGSGKASLKFHAANNGSASLKITGDLKINGVSQPYVAFYVFTPLSHGTKRASFSNLAPGVENGYSAKEGFYKIVSRNSITAKAAFEIGDTSGTATLRLLLKKQSQGTQLIVYHTLSTNTLQKQMIWKFQGFRFN